MGIGSKRIVTGARYGLRDWVGQRITGVILALYAVVVVVGLLVQGPVGYEQWVRIFNFTVFDFPLGKLLAMLAVLSLCYHAWIGVRDIWMDYVKPTGVRLGLQVFTILWLVGVAVYAAQILSRI